MFDGKEYKIPEQKPMWQIGPDIKALRWQAALAVMQGQLNKYMLPNEAAKLAFEFADAMLKEGGYVDASKD